jgi:hypothetical protein
MAYVERRNTERQVLDNLRYGLCSKCGTPRVADMLMGVEVAVCPAMRDGRVHDDPVPVDR